MADTVVEALILDLLEWLAIADRSYEEAVFLQANSPHTITADYLIGAVPFTVQRNIEVSPAFSVEKQTAIEQLPYHSVSKIFLQSRKRFWVEEGLNGFATTDLPIRELWDMTYMQPGTRGILQAYPMSIHSRRVTVMSEPIKSLPSGG